MDFVNGVATAITPIAFFEAVMVRAWETLVDDKTPRSTPTPAWLAASRLQALIESRAGETSLAEIAVKTNRDHRRAALGRAARRCGRRSGAGSRATAKPAEPVEEEEADVLRPGGRRRSSLTTISMSWKTDGPASGLQANGGSRSIGAVERVA